MASAEATWQQRLQKESPGGSVLESFTTGWLNLILQVGSCSVVQAPCRPLIAHAVLLHCQFNHALWFEAYPQLQ